MAAHEANGDTVSNNSRLVTNSKNYTNDFDPNEISPLRTGEAKENVDGDTQVQINMTESSGPDDVDAVPSKSKGKNKLKGAYEAVWTKLDISQKARLPFLIINALCVVLLVILAIMVGLWPNIPNYMREDVCVEKECMESSSQILLSANITEDVCRNPYAWACGKFEDEYLNRIEPHNFLGEWNTKSSADYEEISRIHAFITQMPIAGNTYSAQSILKGLYSACMTSETSAKYQDDFELKQTIFSLRGWEYGENWHANSWDLDEALTTIQSKYGVFPFFKISVENRNSAPFGNIVKISEGEYGLPHKMFYNLSPNHKIISAYQLLLRDFAINFGVVSEMAKKFASHVFHFEQRIVNSLPEVRESGIFTLAKVQKMAPSLPITETITATFPKLNDRTLILVEDVKLLKELSTIVSTTDETPLNNFITWSISRHFLPFMSREYRAALEEFHSKIYGFETAQPTWYFCSRLLRNWMPFAIDSLRQNPQLIVTTADSTSTINNDNNSNGPISEFLIQDRVNYDYELVKMIFYHIKQQLQRSIDENVFIDQDITNFINTKLSATKLQIGIPSEILKDGDYLNKYYKDFYWRKIRFLNNLEYRWEFAKKKMETLLEPMNETDKIIANLYTLPGDNANLLVQYSIDLNMIIVSKRAVERPYFHHKYPIAVNFARIGMEISKSLLKAVFFIGTQYKDELYATHKLVNVTKTAFSLGDTSCLEGFFCRKPDDEIPQRAKDLFVLEVTSGRFTFKCFKEFLQLIDANQPIPSSELDDAVTYDLLNLRQGKRQPGLRAFDNMQLFSMVYMQNYCSLLNGHYEPFKAFVEMEATATERFNLNWDQVPMLKKSFDCSETRKQCEIIL